MTITAIKEHPIPFNTEMVRAVLRGDKTQTRRVVNLKNGSIDFVGSGLSRDPSEPGSDWNNPECWGYEDQNGDWAKLRPDPRDSRDYQIRCPYGSPGDRLWVREQFYVDIMPWAEGGSLVTPEAMEQVDLLRANTYYRADACGKGPPCCELIPECLCFEVGKPRFRAARFMPRWASRITLDLVSVRVERLQDITFEDVLAEGVPQAPAVQYGDGYQRDTVEAFEKLWDSINDERGYGWVANPWVWVVEFKRVHTG